jgi:hypothetical protein
MNSETSARSYKIAGPNFAQDVIDGEAIIVNLEKGIYYSLDRSGARIWQLVSKGASDQEILIELLGAYSGQVSDIEAGLQELLKELVQEGIIAAEEDSAYQRPAATVPAAAEKPAFTKPTLEKYNDMEAILMLDPIHDVGTPGWPYAKSAA